MFKYYIKYTHFVLTVNKIAIQYNNQIISQWIKKKKT